jgi:hypothetical protein
MIYSGYIDKTDRGASNQVSITGSIINASRIEGPKKNQSESGRRCDQLSELNGAGLR